MGKFGLIAGLLGLIGGCVLSAGNNNDDDPPPDDPDAAVVDDDPDAAITPNEMIDARPQSLDADLSCFGEEAIPIQLGALYLGNNADGPNNLEGCANSGGVEAYHRIVLDDTVLPADVTFRIDPDMTNYDSIIKVHAGCDPNLGGIELDCYDDAGSLGEDRVTLTLSIPGVYYVIVDSHPGGGGDYGLSVTAAPPSN